MTPLAEICADLLCSDTSHITSTIIPSCFSVDTHVLPLWTISSVFGQSIYQKYLGFREFAKYRERGKFVASVGHQNAKRFSASGGLCPPGFRGALPP